MPPVPGTREHTAASLTAQSTVLPSSGRAGSHSLVDRPYRLRRTAHPTALTRYRGESRPLAPLTSHSRCVNYSEWRRHSATADNQCRTYDCASDYAATTFPIASVFHQITFGCIGEPETSNPPWKLGSTASSAADTSYSVKLSDNPLRNTFLAPISMCTARPAGHQAAPLQCHCRRFRHNLRPGAPQSTAINLSRETQISRKGKGKFCPPNAT